MTTEEAIAKFERTKVLWESATATEMVEAVKMAITALKENQRLHELGITAEYLEGFDEDEVKTIGDVLRVFGEWNKYRAVGTVEEVQKLGEMQGVTLILPEKKEYAPNTKDSVLQNFYVDGWNSCVDACVENIRKANVAKHAYESISPTTHDDLDKIILISLIKSYFLEEADKTVSEGIKEELKQHSKKVCDIIQNYGKE